MSFDPANDSTVSVTLPKEEELDGFAPQHSYVFTIDYRAEDAADSTLIGQQTITLLVEIEIDDDTVEPAICVYKATVTFEQTV